MSEQREAFWVGMLAMTLAQAHGLIAQGEPGKARKVIESMLIRYTASEQCEPKFERRLARVWRTEDAYERLGS